MRILVTGAEGQLGRSISSLASGKCSRAGNNTVKNEYIFAGRQILDITDPGAVQDFVSGNGIGAVINCAAYTNVDKAETDRETAFAVNRDAVANLASACRKTGSTLIHISTDYVFDGESVTPYTEDMETVPGTVYGASKLAGEKAVAESGCDHIIIRTAWLYSAYGHNFVKTIMRLAQERDFIKVVSDQSGTPTFAGDLARFVFSLAEDGKYHRSGIFHYSNMGECSWFGFASEIVRLAEKYGITDRHCEVLPCTTAEFPTAARRPRYSVLDKSRTIDTFGIGIPAWEDSLLRFFTDEIEGYARKQI